MADLKKEIRRQINAVDVERERLQHKLELLAERGKVLRALLSESPTTGRSGRTRRGRNQKPDSATARAIEKLLQTGAQSKQELVAALIAEKHDFGTKAPARVVHLTIANMRRNGVVEEGTDGKYMLPGHSAVRNGKNRELPLQ